VHHSELTADIQSHVIGQVHYIQHVTWYYDVMVTTCGTHCILGHDHESHDDEIVAWLKSLV